MYQKILRLTLSFFFIAAVISSAQASSKQTKETTSNLIPRTLLFGNPEKADLRLSANGKWLAYLAPSKQGVLNVWVKPIDSRKPAEMVTDDKHRGIRSFFWTWDNKHLLYAQDHNGDETWHVYLVNIENKLVRDLTPFQGVRAQEVMLDKHHPNEMLVGLNIRNRTFFDIYRVNLKTGAVVLDTKNPGDVGEWISDPNFRIRAAIVSNNKDASTSLIVRKNEKSSWKQIMHWPFGTSGGVIDFTKDGKSLYIVSNLKTNTSALLKVNAQNGSVEKQIAHDPKSDVGAVMINPDTYQVEAVSFDYMKPKWVVLNNDIAKDFKRLRTFFKNDFFAIVSANRKNTMWIVANSSDVKTSSYYIYNRKTGKLTFLFNAQPKLADYQFAPMTPVIITARDGLKMVAYLTLPLGKKEKNLPLVLNVHGGPWARDSWRFNPEAQWLANRGYAVLQVNYRGSTGFGKQFINAGNRQWGLGAMQHDLTDAVKWAIKKGIADPNKVCIYGGSYGGYAVLAGLAFTPKLYACGVDLVGPSDLKTLLESIPPYWELYRKDFLLRVGNVEKNETLNRKLSPLYHIKNIRAPLLIAQGEHDPRVNINQSTSMVDQLRKDDRKVVYLIYKDEGHGFARPENRLDFYGRVERFVAEYLGGRSQPFSKVKGAEVVVKD